MISDDEIDNVNQGSDIEIGGDSSEKRKKQNSSEHVKIY
jgi:hypothetical protein